MQLAVASLCSGARRDWRGSGLRWLGHFLIPGVFDGEHIFTIEPLEAGGVRFVQREIFTGLIVPLFMSWMEKDTRRGFEEMNKALKVRAEHQ